MKNYPHSSRRRWHDKSSELSSALGIIRDIESSYLGIFSRMIYNISDNIITHHRSIQPVRELGVERVSGLFKTQSRKRWYDKEYTLYQAIRKLYQLDESYWHQIGILLNTSVEAIGEYIRACHRQGKKFHTEQMEELMDSIVRYGRGNLVAKFKEFGIWDTVCEQLLQSNILFCSSKERPNPMIRQELRSLHYGDDLHTLNKKDTDTLAIEKIQEKDSQMQVISKQVN